MDSRVNELDTNQLIARVNNLSDGTETIKNRQFIGGDSWIFYKVITNQTADMSFALAPGAITVYRISYLPDVADQLCAVNYRLIERFDVGYRLQPIPTPGINNSWDLRYTGSGPGTTNYSATIMMESNQHGSIQVSKLL